MNETSKQTSKQSAILLLHVIQRYYEIYNYGYTFWLWLWFINRKKVKVINKKKLNINKGLYFNKYEYSNY